MNKIYKVIWSKVKNQYVVVSELAHSSGKQSRTSRSSIRSRIAALVVCGAIAAFGVLPMNSAFANEGATITDNDTYFDGVWWDNHETSYTINGQNGITVSQDNSKDIIIGLKPGQGISVSNETGVSIELSKGEGLKFNSNKLAVDAGDGLSTESGHLAVKLAKTGDNDNSGLTVDTNGLKINNGDTLKINNNQLDVNLADNSLTADTTGLKVNAGDGLTAKDANGNDTALSVKTGAGLKIDTNNGDTVAVNVADTSLTADTTGLKVKVKANSGLDTTTDGLAVKLAKTDSGLKFDNDGGLKVDTSSLNSGAVIHEGNNLKDTKASIKYDASNSSSSIALGKGAFAYVQNGNKADAVLFGSDTYTGGIAIGENSTALNATVNIGVKDYTGKMGDVNLSGDDKYKTYEAMSAGETTVGSNSYTSGSLSTNVGSYNIITTKYDSSGGLNSSYALQNTGAIVVGTLNSIESKTSEDNSFEIALGTALKQDVKISGVANNVIGMANKTQNSNGSLVFGTGNEITNSIDTIPTPSNFGGSVSETADSFRDAVSDRSKSNGGAVLAIGGGNKADYALNSQLIGVQNEIKSTKTGLFGHETVEYNMVNGYQNSVIDGSNDTVIGVKNTVTGDSNIVLGDKHTVSGTNNIILGSSGKETTHDVSNTVTIGSGAQALTNNSVAVGSNAQVSANNSVAIGSGSVADEIGGISTKKSTKNIGEKAPDYAGLNPVGTVSVGDKEHERTVTNLAAGRINEKSTDAVNGSQLFKTNEQVSSLETTVNNGWIATDGKGGAVNVTPKDNTLQFNGDKNIDVKADKDKGAINVKLNPVVTLDGTKYDGDGIVLNGESGSIHAVNTQAAGIVGPFGEHIGGMATNKFDFDNDGAKFETKVSGTIGDGIGNSGTLTATKTTKFDENGATFINKKEAKGTIFGIPAGKYTDVSFTNIDGGVVTTDKVQGLDNTKWDDGLANAVDKSKRLQGMAATQGQLRDVDIKVNKNTHDIDDLQDQVKEAGQGWTATDSKGKTTTVEPGDTLKFNGDKNIDVRATDGAINVKLDPVVVLDTEGKRDGDYVVLNGEDGTIKAVNTTKNGHKYGKTTTNIFNFDEDGATFTETVKRGKYEKTDSTSTTINGGTITTDTVKGLNNTEWDANNTGKYADSDRAATEAQLQKAAAASKTTVSAGDNIKVDSTPKDDGHIDYKVSLNDNINLNDRVYINGAPEKGNNIIVDIKSSNKSKEESIFAVEDKGNGSISIGGIDVTNVDGPYLAVGDGKLKFYEDGGLATGNATGTFSVRPDGDLEISGKNSSFDVDAETGNVNAINSSGSAIMMNDDSIALNASGNGMVVSDEGITLNTNGSAVTVDRFNGATFTNTNTTESTNINGATITTGTVKGLKNTTIKYEGFATEGRAATEEQLQQAAAASKTTLSNGTNTNVTSTEKADGHIDYQVNLNKNINLNDRVYINGDPAEGNKTIVDIKSSDKSKEESIFAVEDKGNGSISIGGIDITNVDGPYLAVGDGKLKFYKDGGLSTGNATGTFSVRPDGDLEISGKNSSFNVDAETGNVNAINSSGSAIMMNDDSVALNASGNGVAISDEGILLNTNGINEDIKLVTKGTSVSVDNDGATFTNTNTNETTNIDGGTINVGDRLMVEEDGSIYATNNNGSTVMINDNGVALNSEGNGVVVSGEGITLNANGSAVTVDRFNGTTFTNTNTGETTNINGGTITTDTVKGLSNTTWDDELATQVANSEELQGTAATQGQLLDIQEAVDTVAGQHTEMTVNGGTKAPVIPEGETESAYTDGNLQLKQTVVDGKTTYDIKLNDDITLGNPVVNNPEGERSFTINTTDPEGYVPKSYIDDQGRVDDFVSTHGGFMMYATDTSGHGVFGVTTDGMVHAKDVISYMPNPDNNSDDKILKYSLNDVGDIVTQLAHATFTSGNNATGMEYTLISDFTGETDKENPFVAVDENGKPTQRTIGLAVRQDGAVVVGAVVNGTGVMSNESGIRINDANPETGGGGKDTITGLSNIDWRPAAIRDSISTFGIENDDDSKAKIEKSKAATQGQLDAMYDTVVGYDINESKTDIDYSTITLKGTTYGSTKDGNGSHEGGTLITNVAYAATSGDYDGSAAVNVDLLKDTVADVTSQASNSDRYLTGGNLDGNTLNLTVSDLNGYNNVITIGDIASKSEFDKQIGEINKQIGEINKQIDNIGTGTGGNDNTTITGGYVDETGNVVLKGENKTEVPTDINLTDSAVTDMKFENNTLTITSKDQYDKNKAPTTISVDGIASKDDIKTVNDTIGVTSKEDLKEKYKDADTAYITDSETMVDADIALDHAVQDLASNDQYLNSRIDSVEKRLGDVEQRIDKVGAMAAAIANLRTMGFDPEAPTEIAVGVGQYKSETGLAIGVFHYPNQDFMLSASLSTSGDEVMGGIGATWRIGRKTAAEKAKDEEKRILAKAEEIKQAAKRAEVKAQADRHAKLLAEREAKGESIRPIENKVEQTQEQA